MQTSQPQLRRKSVAALALGGVLLLSTTALSLQDGKGGGKRAGQGAQRAEEPKGEKMEAFRKAIAENKTPLAEAIGLAEAAKQGQAFSAQIRLGKDGKLKIPVEMLVDGKVIDVVVDPETKKVIEATKPEKPEGKESKEAGTPPEKKTDDG